MANFKSDPYFIVNIGGLVINSIDDNQVMDFEFSEGDDEGKYMKISVEDFDMKLMDDPRLVEGKKVDWRYGYITNNYLSDKFKGIVGEVECVFDSGSGIYVMIHVFDGVAQLATTKETKRWRDKPEGIYFHEVVEKIAAKHEMTAVVEPSKTRQAAFYQNNESDWDFIRRIGRKSTPKDESKKGVYRLTFSADNTKLFCKPIKLSGPEVGVYTFYTETENPELISFRPRSQPYDPARTAKDSTQNAEQGPNDDPLPEPETAETQSVRNVTGGKATVSLPSSEITGHIGERTQDPASDDTVRAPAGESAQTVAANKRNEAELKDIEADLTVLMDPTLRRGDTIILRGVGKKFSGKWFIQTNRVIIDDSGAINELGLIKSAAEDAALGNKPATGNTSGEGNNEKSPEKQKNTIDLNTASGV